MTSKEKQKPKEMYSEKIDKGLKVLRIERNKLAALLIEFEEKFAEQKRVIKAIKESDGDRKCYRKIGGILCETTAKEVLPKLETNVQELEKDIESIQQHLARKELEIAEYREKNYTLADGPGGS